MDKHNAMTEKLKVLETEAYNAKVELGMIDLKLQSSYAYEEELVRRQVDTKKKTEELRQQHMIKANEIREIYDKMKSVMDVFTGNFYTK